MVPSKRELPGEAVVSGGHIVRDLEGETTKWMKTK